MRSVRARAPRRRGIDATRAPRRRRISLISRGIRTTKRPGTKPGRAPLAPAAASLDPDLRFRALYNLGLLELLQARSDTTGRDSHLADAERAYREALLLEPHHIRAKWNLELVRRLRGGGGASNPPPNPPPNPGGGGGGGGGAARIG